MKSIYIILIVLIVLIAGGLVWYFGFYLYATIVESNSANVDGLKLLL